MSKESFTERTGRRKRRRSFAKGLTLKYRAVVLILLGMILGSVALTPANAHISTSPFHLWSEHLKPWALSLFYTKSQSNSRYYTKVQTGNLFYNKTTANNLFSKKYAQMIVVAKSGGNYASPTTAMAAISGNSASKPFLIFIAPGVYDLKNSTLAMKPYVDVRGSGRNATVIRSQVGASGLPLASSAIKLANNAVLSELTVENNGTSSEQIAIFSSGNNNTAEIKEVSIKANGASYDHGIYCYFSSPAISNASISVTGGGGYNYGITNNSSNPAVNNTTITVGGATTSNFAINNLANSKPSIVNSTLVASGGSSNYGIYNNTGEITLMSSFLSGSSRDLRQDTGAAAVSYTRLSGGGIDINGGTVQCIGNYSAAMTPVACP